MVTIYDAKTIDFDNLGLGEICPSSVIVAEELNGIFTCEITHPYDDNGKHERLDVGRIIKVSTPSGKQLFRIYNVTPTMDSIKIYANHITYDLVDNHILAINGSNITAQAAMELIVESMGFEMPFVLSTNIDATGSVFANNVNPISALLGDSGDGASFIQAFGGELVRDNFSVKMLIAAGIDRGYEVRYRKNMIGLEVNEDISNVITRLYPIGANNIMLPERFIDSERINDYPYPKAYTQTFSEAKNAMQLREAALDFLAGGADLPTVNIRVSFQPLSKSIEYKEFQFLEKILLGDIVSIYNSRMSFAQKVKVISYKWDALLDRYIEVELGDFLATLTGNVSTLGNEIRTVESVSADMRILSEKLSGKFRVIDGVTYYADNANIDTASKIFRLGAAEGLQLSTTGINGTWKTIIDNNGNIAN